jgi:nucleoredoxin
MPGGGIRGKRVLRHDACRDWGLETSGARAGWIGVSAVPALVFIWCLAVSAAWAALPAEVTLVAPAKFEILKEGRSTGSVALRAGERLEVIEVADGYLRGRYRNLTGRVPVEATNLPPIPPPALVAPPAATVVPAPPPAAPPVGTPAAAAPAVTVPPASFMGRVLDGKLVVLEGGAFQRCPPARLAGVKFYGILFSAGWCGPCRAFAPELLDAYGKIRALYPEFEVVLVNRDRSAAAMLAYVREERMPWPALAWDALKTTPEVTRHAGSGIPCLVLVDENGKVLSDSYRWGRYVGPDAVLDDTWKILRTHRRANPRRPG